MRTKVIKKPSTNQDRTKLEFDIEPEQGAGALFGMCALKGHELVKMLRRGRKLTCWYQKLKSPAAK